jgi:hypothetical protein
MRGSPRHIEAHHGMIIDKDGIDVFGLLGDVPQHMMD